METNSISTAHSGSLRLTVLIFLLLVVTPSWPEQLSRYLDQLEAVSYPAADNVNESVNLRWDLYRGKQHNYDYREQAFYRQIVRGRRPDDMELVSQQSEVRGQAVLQSTFDKSARLSLTAKTDVKTMLPDGKIDTQTGLKGSYVIEDITSRGKYISRKPLDLHFQSLMRLPDRQMKIGDTFMIPVSLTNEFLLQQQQITLDGEIRMTLAGYVQCNDHICAELHTTTRITENSLPEETIEKNSTQYVAQGRSWFDLEDRKLVESIRVTFVESDSEAPVQKPDSRLPEDSASVHVLTWVDSLVHLKHKQSGPSLAGKPTIKKYRRIQAGHKNN